MAGLMQGFDPMPMMLMHKILGKRNEPPASTGGGGPQAGAAPGAGLPRLGDTEALGLMMAGRGLSQQANSGPSPPAPVSPSALQNPAAISTALQMMRLIDERRMQQEQAFGQGGMRRGRAG